MMLHTKPTQTTQNASGFYKTQRNIKKHCRVIFISKARSADTVSELWKAISLCQMRTLELPRLSNLMPAQCSFRGEKRSRVTLDGVRSRASEDINARRLPSPCELGLVFSDRNMISRVMKISPKRPYTA